MTRLIYMIKELFLNIYRHFATAVGLMLSLMLLFMLFNLFWVGAGTSKQVYEQLVAEMQMDVYLSENMTDSMIVSLQAEVAKVPGIASLVYISKEDARQLLMGQIGVDLLVGYDTLNPLPRSFLLEFEPKYRNLEGLAHIEDKLNVLPGITETSYSSHWLKKIELIRSITVRVGLALGLLVMLTVLLSSTNNIRLMARARAVGFRQMLLMGTGRMFIAVPFLIEGFLMAGLAAVAGWAAILYGYQRVTFTQFEIILPSMPEIIYYCLGCAMLGLISGWLGIRSELKER